MKFASRELPANCKFREWKVGDDFGVKCARHIDTMTSLANPGFGGIKANINSGTILITRWNQNLRN